MSNGNQESRQETISDIVAEMRVDNPIEYYPAEYGGGVIPNRTRDLADRIEAIGKRKMDSIRRAMVLIAGIEMEDPENPPRLWTALEDAYDALSNALGTDGDTSADVEEAKAIGRHFVVKSYSKAAPDASCCSNCSWYHIYNNGLAELREDNECLRAALTLR